MTSLYQQFWFALFVAILISVISIKYKSIKSVVIDWYQSFRHSKSFRIKFFFHFYFAMILLRTLFNRSLWVNPLINVMGNMWIYDSKGELSTQCIENLVLFIPFIALLLCAYPQKIIGKDCKLWEIIWKSTIFSFALSSLLEFLQLFLHIGTWQLSDILYNTLGGIIGGIIYWIFLK